MTEKSSPPPVISPAPYVTIHLAAAITGLSEKAIRRKIEEGKWIDGREYRRSPDGGIFISIKGFAQWVEKATA
ncbi:MAG: excisionase [Burkholderiales bacterium]|nr:excisionase [Burkholderiales bacterium]